MALNNPYLLKANPYLAQANSVPSWYEQHNKELQSFSGGDQSSRSSPGTISAPSGPSYGGSLSASQNGGMFGGIAGSVLGTALGVPGLGMIGSALSAARDNSINNEQLASLGLPGMGYGNAIMNSMSMGLLGNSPVNAYNAAITAQYPGLLAAMTPAPPVAAAAPQMGFFDAINDYNTVGRLGEIFGGQGGGGYQGGTNTTGNNSDFGSDGGDVY